MECEPLNSLRSVYDIMFITHKLISEIYLIPTVGVL